MSRKRKLGQSPRSRNKGPGLKGSTVTIHTKEGTKVIDIRVYRQMVNDLKQVKKRALRAAEGTFVGKAKAWAKDFI